MIRRTMLGRLAAGLAAMMAGAGLFVSPAVAHDGCDKNKNKEVEGTLTALDTTAGTVTITNRKGVATTLTIPSTATITRNHKTATLADFKVNDRVEAHLNATTSVVTSLRGRGL